ncbi:MAG: ATP synthase subunit C [Spirochaetaceae bacterium]|jgi:V/A-type H+-transporting ATPase subunit K|nr:ATP synthase subunit C [Spirochaetaceae bacterium]
MKRILFFACLAAALLCAPSAAVFAQEAEAAANAGNTSVWKYFAAALAVGISCVAGGIAVGQIGAAAMGAMSENPELSGKALPYAGLAEGICLWGFLVALLILIL